jgi:hypothetical protein
MRKLTISLFGSLLISLLSISNLSIAADEPDLGGGRISLLQGQVLLQTKRKGLDRGLGQFSCDGGDRILTNGMEGQSIYE